MDDKLFLPHGSSLEVVHQIRDALTDALKNMDVNKQLSENKKEGNSPSSAQVSSTPPASC